MQCEESGVGGVPGRRCDLCEERGGGLVWGEDEGMGEREDVRYYGLEEFWVD